MPVTPLVAYPNAEQVMNRARAIVNDAYQGGQGRILTDTAPFTIEYLNDALEELQDELRDYGSITFIKDNYIMTPVTPVLNINPQVQTNISFTGYFDGTIQHPLPVLPGDMLEALTLWETMTGSNLPMQEMAQPQGPLTSCYQQEWLGEWEWRTDMIWFHGATTSRDVRLRYRSQLQPLAAASPSNPLSNVQISVQASTRAMALLVAYNYTRARGGQAVQLLKPDADKALWSVKNRYVLQGQGHRLERIPYGGDSGNWNGANPARSG